MRCAQVIIIIALVIAAKSKTDRMTKIISVVFFALGLMILLLLFPEIFENVHDLK